jgi:hypothetical protein
MRGIITGTVNKQKYMFAPNGRLCCDEKTACELLSAGKRQWELCITEL